MDWLANSLKEQWQQLGAPPLVIGVSGGLDSMLLLHCLASVIPVQCCRVLHIDHQLNPESGDWARHVQAVSQSLGLKCCALEVEVTAWEQGPEGAARQARYRAFRDNLSNGEVLVLAQHRDDQIETILMRARASSLPEMLKGMPTWRKLGKGKLWRPILDVSREEIHTIAEQQGLSWVSDPSNLDTRIARNAIRHRVLPSLLQQSAGIEEGILRLGRAAQHLTELNSKIAAHDLAQVEAGSEALFCAGLAHLSDMRRANLLRHWLDVKMQQGIQERFQELLEARDDAAPTVRLGGWELRRYRDRLWRMPPLLPTSAVSCRWDTRAPLDMNICGTLRVNAPLLKALTVSFAQGGERIRLPGRAHHSRLKKLWQAAGVPPWIRRRTPLVWLDEELLAVGNRWVSSALTELTGKQESPFSWTHHLVGDPPHGH